MIAISLIAAPGGLDPALVDNLRNAWGGGVAQWLAVDEAAEFHVETVPGNFRAVWADLQKEGVDLNHLSTGPRRKRVLLADMDSTMIQQECIDELAAQAGVGEKVVEITARAMNGELDFEEALRARVGLLRGVSADLIEEVAQTRLSYTPGGAVLLRTMRANGAYAALVSGGFTAFTARVAHDLGFDMHRANTLNVEDGRLTGDVGLPILGRDAKVEALHELGQRLELTPADVLAVGDGANDLGMLGAAGLGVALHAKPSVQEACDIRINHGDLTALLYLQGYAQTEFVHG